MKARRRLWILLASALALVSCAGEPALSSLVSSSITASSEASSAISSKEESSSEAALSSATQESSSEASVASSAAQESSSELSNQSTASSSNSIPVISSSSAAISSESSSSEGSDWDYLIDANWPNLDFSKYGNSFRADLASLIEAKNPKTCSYDSTLSEGAKAAAYPNENSSTFVAFYHEPDNHLATIGACNREHTWPDSRGGNLIEKDPVVIRPTFSAENNSRSNYFYDLSGSKRWDPASVGFEGARGESARVILYAAARYASKGLSLSNNPADNKTLKTMGTLSRLLEWNRTYKPTAFEKLVNERYVRLGYARNPFVDHPEYADFIWSANGYRTSPYLGPSEATSSSSSSAVSFSAGPDSSSSDSANPPATSASISFASESQIVGEKNGEMTVWKSSNEVLTFALEKNTSPQDVGNGSFFSGPLRTYSGQKITITATAPFTYVTFTSGSTNAYNDATEMTPNDTVRKGDGVFMLPSPGTSFSFVIGTRANLSAVSIA